MSQSLLQGKRFFCREWAFSKIAHCLDNRASSSSKSGGALVVGGPGCGKTALCCELTSPTAAQGRQLSLCKRLLAHHYCQAHDVDTLALDNFVLGLVDQISRSDLVSGYSERVADPEVQEALTPERLDADPDEAFKRAVLFPLLEVEVPKQTCFVLVDSIDESFMTPTSAERQSDGGRSRTVAELLASHHHLLPKWLLLVCSARKQSKSVTRLFAGFRKISLDDLRKSHVVRDIQQYILCRLDREPALRQHLSRETAEMLNQLHIKSNGCFLYLEKVLDGVAENFIMLREIREIPGTLNGLYLWLCQRLFVRKQFSRVQPILDVILATRRPLTEEQIYQCVWTRNTNLTREDFSKRFSGLSKLLADGRDKTRILFHHSFAEWLLDVKHCTQKYLCHAGNGHSMLAARHSLCARTLQPAQVVDFALHLSRMPACPPLLSSYLPLWMVLCRAPLEEVLARCPRPPDHRVVHLLVEAGAKPPPLLGGERDGNVTSPKVPSDPLDALIAAGGDMDQADHNQRTLLHAASYEGNSDLAARLVTNGAGLERTDKTGQTPLNLASRQGHVKVVEILLSAGSNPDHADNDGWTPLRSAAWAGHTQVVNALLEKGAEVDLADADHRTALRAASWGGHDEIVTRLLEHGAQVNKVDKEGRTALIAAAYMGHTEIVEQLLEHGAEINQEDADGRTALSVAALCVPASEGHAGVVSLLLDCGAEVDHRDKDGMTPLLVAAFEGHSEVCELLLEGDADVDHTDDSGRTPLLAAASMGHPAVVNLLLFWGAAIDTIDSEGRTVLSIAAAQGNADVVRQLLDRGLDETHRDNAGWTPLHYASFEGHSSVCEVLVEAGARTSEVDNDGRIPLILAAQEGHHQVAAKLLQPGRGLVNHRAHDGKTALRVATIEGHKETVHLLLSEGADMNYLDADGRSTLYLLALENRMDMAEFLLTRGAEVDARDLEGRTPLHVSAWQGHLEMVDLLLSHGADVNAADNDQRTALQSAAWQGHSSVVRLLLERRAQVDHTCNQGATALCISAQEGHESVVAVLLEYGADPDHADQFGRNPLRVATKGGHLAVVRLLEEFAEQQQRGPGGCGSASTASLGSASTAETKPCSAILCGQPGTGSPREETEKRKSFLSNHSSSRSSSNLTSSTKSFPTSAPPLPLPTQTAALPLNNTTTDCRYTVSSLPPRSTAPPPGMTFTQQLQQCTRNRNRASRILSPLGEPRSPVVSPPQSPSSEVFSPVQQILAEDRKYPLDIPRPTESRFKRNGIVTNPNFKPGGVGVKGTTLREEQQQLKNKHNVVSYEESIKCSGLPLKKETPL